MNGTFNAGPAMPTFTTPMSIPATSPASLMAKTVLSILVTIPDNAFTFGFAHAEHFQFFRIFLRPTIAIFVVPMSARLLFSLVFHELGINVWVVVLFIRYSLFVIRYLYSLKIICYSLLQNILLCNDLPLIFQAPRVRILSSPFEVSFCKILSTLANLF